jgi:hypothetical protein
MRGCRGARAGAGRHARPMALPKARRYNESHSEFLAQFLAIPSEGVCEPVRLTAFCCNAR